jgi:hypothetical protein
MRPTTSSTIRNAAYSSSLASSSSNTIAAAGGSDAPSSTSSSLQTTATAKNSRTKSINHNNDGSASPNSRQQQNDPARSAAAHARTSKSKQTATADDLSDSGYDDSIDGSKTSNQTLLEILHNIRHNYHHSAASVGVVTFKVKDGRSSVEMDIPLCLLGTVEQIQEAKAEEGGMESIEQELDIITPEKRDVALLEAEHSPVDQESIQQLEAMVKEVSDKLECLNEDLENIKKKDNQGAVIEMLAKTMREAEDKLQIEKQERNALEVKIEELQASIASEVAGKEKLEAKRKEERKGRLEAEELNTKKGWEVFELGQEKEVLIADRIADRLAAENQVASLKEELRKCQNGYRSLERQCDEQQAMIENFKLLKTQRNDLETQLVRSQFMTEELQKTYTQLRTDHSQLEQQHTQLQTDHAQLEQQHTQLQTEHAHLTQQQIILSQEQQTLYTDIELLGTRLQNVSDQQKELEEENNILQTQIADLEEYKEVLQAAFDKSDEDWIAAKQQIALLRRRLPPTSPSRAANAHKTAVQGGRVENTATSATVFPREGRCEKHGRYCLVV